MGEEVERGCDSEDTSSEGQQPSDDEELSDEDCVSIPSDGEPSVHEESDSDYDRGISGESDSGSIGDESDGDADAMAEGLAADVEPMMESASVQMLLD